EGSPETTTERYMESYKNVSQDIRDQLNTEAEAVQIILTGIDNDIYSTVNACPNVCELWKAIERWKHGESINVQDLETNLYWEFGKFTSQDDDETSKDKEIDKLMALISLSFKKIYKPTNNNLQTSSNTSHANQDNSPRINRRAGYENQRNGIGAGARETVGSSVVQKSGIQCYNCKEFGHVAREYAQDVIIDSLDMSYDREEIDQNDDDNDLAKECELLSSLIEKLKCEIDESKNRNKFLKTSNKKIYKTTNNNLRTSSNTSRANQDNSLRINRGTGYDNKRIGNVAGARETVEQADSRDDTDDEFEDQELEAHYMYMAQLHIQKVTPDAADNSGPIFDTEPLQKVPNNDNYNVFAIENEHPEQSQSVHDTYPIEQDEHNVIIDSLDMSYDSEHID
nr:hypothetical protein [Tanacetum cinerariifolium]